MAIIFLAFGRTPSVITKKVHVRNYFKTDDVQIVFYNDLNICRYIFLNLSTNKKYSSIHPWDFPKILINKIEKKYQIHPQYIISGLWDAGNRKRIAKNLFIRHKNGMIYKNNNNSFFIWVECAEEDNIEMFQNYLKDPNEYSQFIEEEYVLIAKLGIDKLAKYLLMKNGENRI